VPDRDLDEQLAVPADQCGQQELDDQGGAEGGGGQAEARPHVGAPSRTAQAERGRPLAGPAQQEQRDRHRNRDGQVRQDAQREVGRRVGDIARKLGDGGTAGMGGERVHRGHDTGYQEDQLDEPGLKHQVAPGLPGCRGRRGRGLESRGRWRERRGLGRGHRAPELPVSRGSGPV